MHTICRSDGNEKNRYDHRQHGKGDMNKSYEAERPNQSKRYTGERDQDVAQPTEQPKKDYRNKQKCYQRKTGKIFLGLFDQGLGNDRHLNLIHF